MDSYGKSRGVPKLFLLYVVNSKDVHQFKINIDNYWSKYDILYNYKAQPPSTIIIAQVIYNDLKLMIV